jgi:hypothetical protein
VQRGWRIDGDLAQYQGLCCVTLNSLTSNTDWILKISALGSPSAPASLPVSDLSLLIREAPRVCLARVRQMTNTGLRRQDQAGATAGRHAELCSKISPRLQVAGNMGNMHSSSKVMSPHRGTTQPRLFSRPVRGSSNKESLLFVALHCPPVFLLEQSGQYNARFQSSGNKVLETSRSRLRVSHPSHTSLDFLYFSVTRRPK